MSEEETAEIVQYLVEAAFQLDEARAAAALLSEQDGEAAAVGELTHRLNSELLTAIFARFSDYLAFEEFPEITSCLRWDQVRLPPDLSETRLGRDRDVCHPRQVAENGDGRLEDGQAR